MQYKIYKLSIFLIIVFFTKIIFAQAYFDLSENNIKIKTDFNGKEIIVFGILNDEQETLITIKAIIIPRIGLSSTGAINDLRFL